MFHKDSSGEYLEQQLENNKVKHYKRRRVLGKGGFAKCYEVTDQATNIRYACKVIDKDLLSHSQLKQKLQTQIQIHRRMSHPNIVKFERVFQDDQFIYILLQLCINNTLNQLLKRRKVLSEVEVRYYMFQLLQGLKYLHKNKIVHRDLKLDNFFLGENLDVKIGDFGLAAEVSHRPRKTLCGTPNYIAPQIFESRSGYSYEVDVWSLGVTAYLLLYGHYPFENNDSKSMASRINSKTYLINPSLSDISKNFISKMLQVKPQERWTAKQLLEHDFLTYFQIPKSLPRSSLACPLNSNFLDQFKCKKNIKLDLKQDEEFNFMLESRQSHSSPRAKHSNYNQSMSASKIMKMSQQQNLPYIFSQKKLDSFRQYNPDQKSSKVNPWVTQYYSNPKYGLLYQTSEDTYGVIFNDSTILKAHPYPYKFTYISARGETQKISVQTIKSKQLPAELRGKLKAMSLMMEKWNWKRVKSEHQGVHVKMYVNTLNMLLLWLSNDQLQVKFADTSEFIIGKRVSMYINPHKIKIVFESKDLPTQNEEIVEKQKMIAQRVSEMSKKCVKKQKKDDEQAKQS